MKRGKKVLVVYYSFEGSTKLIAETVAKSLKADILSLESTEQPKTKGFMKYIWGGRQVFFKSRPKLAEFDKDPLKYDTLFIGTPVWAFTFTPALRSFFSKTKLKNKNIALFCCHEGGMKNTLKNMEDVLKDNKIIGKIDFVKPAERKTKENKKRAEEWAKETLSNIK